GVDTEDGVTVNTMVFDLSPKAEITVTDKDGKPVTLTMDITEDMIDGKIEFVLPVDKSVTEKEVALYHEGEFIGKATIKEDENGNKYIEVETDSFGEFSYTVLNDKTAGTKVGDTYYRSLADAISEVKNGETIILTKDTDERIVISREVSFKIDSNGYKNNVTIVAGRGYTVIHIGNRYTVMKAVIREERERAEHIVVLSGYDTERNETNPETGAPVMNFGAIAVILGAAFLLSKKH
ncbi:MAG: phage baseplate upper protein, partial [Clostridia bacterium]|nr:phage baseplate upper protein [Clostridia bacterium]